MLLDRLSKTCAPESSTFGGLGRRAFGILFPFRQLAHPFIDHCLPLFGKLKVPLPCKFLLCDVAGVEELLSLVTAADKLSEAHFCDKHALVVVGVDLFASWVFVWLYGLQMHHVKRELGQTSYYKVEQAVSQNHQLDLSCVMESQEFDE